MTIGPKPETATPRAQGPWARSFTADREATWRNSTIRIAFLLASPTRTTKPIWVKMLMSAPGVSARPRVALSNAERHDQDHGEAGSDQLSYCAAQDEEHHDHRGSPEK